MIGDPRLPAKFWEKVFPCPVTGCWLWTAAIHSAGYGVIRYQKRLSYGHRVAYEALVGELTHGLELDHLCRVRSCEYKGENLLLWSDGRRRCLVCTRAKAGMRAA